MSMDNVRAFRAAAVTNPDIDKEARKAKSWEEMVTVAKKFGFSTTVTAHLAYYRSAPKDLSAFENEIFRDGGFPWCR